MSSITISSVILSTACLLVSGCTGRDGSTTVLVATSAFGSRVHIASFDGNSSDKGQDCQEVATLLKEKYGRDYSCREWQEVKDEIK